MATGLKEKEDICMDCNSFHVSCTGELFERPEGYSNKGCVSQIRDPHNTPSPIQVTAFLSLYRAKRSRGMDNLMSFVEAVVNTSDDAYRKALKKRPNLIKRYNKNGRKTKKSSTEQL